MLSLGTNNVGTVLKHDYRFADRILKVIQTIKFTIETVHLGFRLGKELSLGLVQIILSQSRSQPQRPTYLYGASCDFDVLSNDLSGIKYCKRPVICANTNTELELWEIPENIDGSYGIRSLNQPSTPSRSSALGYYSPPPEEWQGSRKVGRAPSSSCPPEREIMVSGTLGHAWAGLNSQWQWLRVRLARKSQQRRRRRLEPWKHFARHTQISTYVVKAYVPYWNGRTKHRKWDLRTYPHKICLLLSEPKDRKLEKPEVYKIFLMRFREHPLT